MCTYCLVWTIVKLQYLVIMYYYYSHIFPESWAQHCNFATLLAGRIEIMMSLTYSISTIGEALSSLKVYVLVFCMFETLVLFSYHHLSPALQSGYMTIW